MIGISSRERITWGWCSNEKKVRKRPGVRPLRQGFCERTKSSKSSPLFHKLQTQKERTGLLASRMSPIELPLSCKQDKGQSHDYPNTTKGNPIQGRPKSPFPLQLRPLSHCFQYHSRVGLSDSNSKSGRNRAVSRYRIASMAARFRIAWLDILMERTRNQFANKLGRVSGDFLPKLEVERYGYTLLCVSFECDSLSEELTKKKRKNFCRMKIKISCVAVSCD